MFWTHTNNEGRSNERFSLTLCMYKCVSRDIKRLWITYFVLHNKNFNNLFKNNIFILSLVIYITIYTYIYPFIIWIYFTLALLIYPIYIYLYTNGFIHSLWQFNTRQASVNEHQWYRIVCLTRSYATIICLYIVCRTHFIFMCIHIHLYMTRWRNNLFHTKI